MLEFFPVCCLPTTVRLPRRLSGKESPAEQEGTICPLPHTGCGEGNGNPLQYSCLENPRDRGAWWAAVCGVAQSRTRLKRLSKCMHACMAGDIRDLGLIPGWGRSPGGGKGYPLQYSPLGNPMDRGSWRAAVHGVTERQTRLSDRAHTALCILYTTPSGVTAPEFPLIQQLKT